MSPLSKLSDWFSRPEGIERALGFVAVLAFGLGFWQLRTSIALPFAPKLISGSSVLTAGDAIAQVDGTALRNKDTDGDGLSDYDEVNLYRTSVYLKDTDSDTFDDKTEVDTSNDPTCARGSTCGLAYFTSPSAQTTDTVATPTAAELRQLLKENGLPETELAKYDDAELLKLYQELAGENPSSSSAGTTSTNLNSDSAVQAAQKEAIGKMSAAELRQLLIQGGADEATLKKVDDTTLKAMVLETIGS